MTPRVKGFVILFSPLLAWNLRHVTAQDVALAVRIRKARRQKDLSQVQLAAKVGVKPRTVMRWEHPDTPQHPNPQHAAKLSRVLEIAVPPKPAAPTSYQLHLQELADELAALREEFEAFVRLVADRLGQGEGSESSGEANGRQR